MRKLSRIHNLMFLNNAAQNYLDKILESSEIQNVINSNTKYDLVFGELGFIDAVFAFGYKFNAPVIAVRPQTMSSYHNWILGNPFPSSYVPNSYLPFTEKMSLPARIVNTVFNFVAGEYCNLQVNDVAVELIEYLNEIFFFLAPTK